MNETFSEYEEEYDFPNVKANHPKIQFASFYWAQKDVLKLFKWRRYGLDPFAGVNNIDCSSKNNRKAVGYELEKKYISSGRENKTIREW